MGRYDSVPSALAAALGGSVWLHQVFSSTAPPLRVLIDRAIFLFVAAYAVGELSRAIIVRVRRVRVVPPRAAGRLPHGDASSPARAHEAAGLVVLVALLLAQTLTHVDEQSPYLYMTYPRFPTGIGTSADGYVVWLDGRPAYAESWQFAKLANLFSGAVVDRDTGDTDARGAYSYLAALLARPLGFVPAFIALNLLFWLAACLAVWYLGSALLGSRALGFVAALLTSCGHGFTFMVSTPMSYVAGYGWWALLLALAARWSLFGWSAGERRWLAWGFACGVGGLFYFTHVVAVGMSWLFGARRAPLRSLVCASALAMLLPAAWYVVGSRLVGLGFRETTANDLFGQVRVLGQLAASSPLLLPSAAGQSALRALLGGFGWPLLAVAAVGMATASPRRRQWYVAVAACGLAPVFILHMIPVTQRYAYLAYPSIYLAATEGIAWVARALTAKLRVPRGVLIAVGGAALVAAQLYRANADLLGDYRFALAFGAP